MRTIARLAVVTFSLVLPALPAPAQDAEAPQLHRIAFDATFGSRGPARRLARVRRLFDTFDHVALDSAGRIVVGGQKHLRPAGNPRKGAAQPRVARFLPDGSLDATFGDGGIKTVPLRNEIRSLAVDSSDRVVLGGSFADHDELLYAAVRLRADGQLDPEFAEGGLLPYTQLFGDLWTDIRIAADGESFHAVAHRGDNQFGPTFLVRVTPSGDADVGYGTGGFSTVQAGIPEHALDPQGRSVVLVNQSVTRTNGTTFVRRAVLRFESDGSPDPAFGAGGALSLDGVSEAGANRIDVDSLGRILAFDSPLGPNPGLHRFLPDGSLDTQFAAGGRADWADAVPGVDRPDPTPYLVTARDAPDRLLIAGGTLAVDESTGRFDEHGIYAKTFDSSDPGRVGLLVDLTRPGGTRHLSGVAISPDGTSAIFVGAASATRTRATPTIERVDLTLREPTPLPDIVPSFVGRVTVEAAGAGARIRARVNFENTGESAWKGGNVDFYRSLDPRFDASDALLFRLRTPEIAPGRTRRRGIVSPILLLDPESLTGAFLLAVVPSVESHETDTENNVAAWHLEE